jgi:hypothetical protein
MKKRECFIDKLDQNSGSDLNHQRSRIRTTLPSGLALSLRIPEILG